MTLTEYRAYKRLPVPIASARGCEIVLSDGRRVLDLYGGHCVNTLGAGDPELGALVARQWEELSFTTNLLHHGARQAFLDAFAPNLPPGDWQVFCSNSGAEANENALKIALAATGRSKVVYFDGAFHGRTAAAAAVSDTKTAAFPKAPFTAVKLPWGDADAARRAIDGATAAVLLEPIQSLAGVRVPPPGFLEALRAACGDTGALLVFDEVQTGNGRLGAPWAAQHYRVNPDVFTTAKGAAGGLPIGLTVLAAELAARLPENLLGSTFGGGPLALAAAALTARRIAAPGFLERVRKTSEALTRAASRPPVRQVRGAGLLLGLVLEDGVSGAKLRDALLAHGVLVGTSDDPGVLRLAPPLTLEPSAASRFSAALDAAARTLEAAAPR
jgi:acetylornithine/succinyldiaminopimelate/putrescine aminotransferase